MIEDKLVPDEQRARAPEQAPQALPQAPKPLTKSEGAPLKRGAAQPNRTDSAALAHQLDKIDLAIVGVLSSDQPATASVLKRGDVALQPLDAVAAKAAGVGPDSGGPKGGAPIRPGTRDIRDLGTKALGPDGPGQVAQVRGPKWDATIAPPSTTGGTVSNAARVVADMRPGFRTCYQRGLNENPDASGSIRLTIRVGPGGEVLAVTPIASGNLPASVVSCVQARVRAAQFDPPEGGAAVIQVPVTFVRQ